MLCDGALSGLDPDNAFIIYQAMMNLCVADARKDLGHEFFEVSESLGFPHVSPRDEWRSSLRLLTEILHCRNSTNMTRLIQTLKHQLDSLSFLQISQKLSESFVAEDEEIARFLLIYSGSMKGFYEGRFLSHSISCLFTCR